MCAVSTRNILVEQVHAYQNNYAGWRIAMPDLATLFAMSVRDIPHRYPAFEADVIDGYLPVHLALKYGPVVVLASPTNLGRVSDHMQAVRGQAPGNPPAFSADKEPTQLNLFDGDHNTQVVARDLHTQIHRWAILEGHYLMEAETRRALGLSAYEFRKAFRQVRDHATTLMMATTRQRLLYIPVWEMAYNIWRHRQLVLPPLLKIVANPDRAFEIVHIQSGQVIETRACAWPILSK